MNEEKEIKCEGNGNRRFLYKNDTVSIDFSSVEAKAGLKGCNLEKETLAVFDVLTHEWFWDIEVDLPIVNQPEIIIENLLRLFNMFTLNDYHNTNFRLVEFNKNFRVCYKANEKSYVGYFMYDRKYHVWRFMIDTEYLINQMGDYVREEAIEYWYNDGNDCDLKPIEKWFFGMFSFDKWKDFLYLHEDEKNSGEVISLYQNVKKDPALRFAVEPEFIEFMK